MIHLSDRIDRIGIGVSCVISLILAIFLVLVTSCTPDANATTLRVTEVKVVTHGATKWVKGAWKNASITDGLGPLTSIATYNKIGTDSTGHTLVPTATVDSFQFTSQVAATVSGLFCVRAQRRALYAPITSASCKTWTYTEQDQAPPASTIDSLWISGAFRTTGTGTIQLMATGETCTYTTVNYYQQDFAVLNSGQSQACGDAFDRNLKSASDFAFSEAIRVRDSFPTAAAKWDSASPNPYPTWSAELPHFVLDTHFEPNVGPDTFVAAGGQVVAIADYRAQHPGFTWP